MAFSISLDQGLGGSDIFDIKPVDLELLENGKPYSMPCDNKKKAVLLIWEDYAESFLFIFFERWLDPNYIWQNKYNHGGVPVLNLDGYEFDRWGWNYYSYDHIRGMIADLRQVADQFEKNPEDEKLDPYMRHFSLYCMMETEDPEYIALEDWLIKTNPRRETLREDWEERYQKQRMLMLKHIHPVIQFYREVADALEKLLDSMPECDTICIEGP